MGEAGKVVAEGFLRKRKSKQSNARTTKVSVNRNQKRPALGKEVQLLCQYRGLGIERTSKRKGLWGG